MGKSRCQKDRQGKGSSGLLAIWLSAIFQQMGVISAFFFAKGKISILWGFPDEGLGNGAPFGLVSLSFSRGLKNPVFGSYFIKVLFSKKGMCT